MELGKWFLGQTNVLKLVRQVHEELVTLEYGAHIQCCVISIGG